MADGPIPFNLPLRCLPFETQNLAVSNLRLANNRSEEHTSELQSPCNLVCRLLLEKKKIKNTPLRFDDLHSTGLQVAPPSRPSPSAPLPLASASSGPTGHSYRSSNPVRAAATRYLC